MRTTGFVFSGAVLAFTAISLTASFAANIPVDATVKKAPRTYVPAPTDVAYNGVTAGDVAAAEVSAVGASLQYTGLVLNGDGVNANAPIPFLKVQSQNGAGSFDHAACYLGNNGSSGAFGLGFFTLSQPFKAATMRATRSGSTVTIALTHVDGGTLPDQTYVCHGAPAPVGDKIGVHGYAANTARLDNFRACATVLDDFSYTGPLSGTGNWNDAAPGMYANGRNALGGPGALSYWLPALSCPQ